ncbi:NfeD family protein [Mesorhizobium sp. YIM 152430]|uniref:NfeD family protein n=1 Tax=Mesorhizobium sp. YIM 152430 TaxID=3031761 RepID=UPI0023DB05C0|nr:NfeD family protein [Mesorhizobium sp. YIM 152430]MDF1601719.1 NfeD family protein [Mesorhizobium sp. YIM 152430]
MIEFLSGLGAWNWIVLGAVLLGLEVLVPGVYLLWIGIAALLTGALSFQIGEAAWWGWPAQVIVFLVLSLASVIVGRYAFGSDKGESDQPLLNQRERQLMGQVSTLEEPIRDGHGRIRLGDTLWLATGPDLAAGTRVRVTGADGTTLRVEAV